MILKWLIAAPALLGYLGVAGTNWYRWLASRRSEDGGESPVFLGSAVCLVAYATVRPVEVPWWAYAIALALDPANLLLLSLFFPRTRSTED